MPMHYALTSLHRLGSIGYYRWYSHVLFSKDYSSIHSALDLCTRDIDVEHTVEMDVLSAQFCFDQSKDGTLRFILLPGTACAKSDCMGKQVQDTLNQIVIPTIHANEFTSSWCDRSISWCGSKVIPSCASLSDGIFHTAMSSDSGIVCCHGKSLRIADAIMSSTRLLLQTSKQVTYIERMVNNGIGY